MERARKSKEQRKFSVETEKLVASDKRTLWKGKWEKYLYNVNKRDSDIKCFARGKTISNDTFVLFLIPLLKTVTVFHYTFLLMSKGLEQNGLLKNHNYSTMTPENICFSGPFYIISNILSLHILS